MFSRRFLTLSLLFFFFFSFSDETWALKTRTRSQTSTRTYTASNRITTSVRFTSGKTGLVISFSGLNNATSVNYSLTYNTNGIPQGAMGTITSPQVVTDSRELLFGTCSHGVCRYHTNITNAKLVITAKLRSGYTTRKTYRLRI